MKNKCKQCGKLNEDEAQFCDNCGVSFSDDPQPIESNKSDDVISTEQVVAIAGKTAEQATIAINKTKEKTAQTTKTAKKIWKKFSLEERMVAVGSFLGLISFVLPWMNLSVGSLFADAEVTSLYGIGVARGLNYLFLFPIFMIVILALLQSSRKITNVAKAKRARFYLLFGSMGFVAGCSVKTALIWELTKDGGLLFASVYIIPAFGWWLFLGSMVLLTIGGFRLQGKLLDDIKEQQTNE